MIVDDMAGRGPVGLVYAVVHVHPIAEAAGRDQCVEGRHPLLVELHRCEHVGVHLAREDAALARPGLR